MKRNRQEEGTTDGYTDACSLPLVGGFDVAGDWAADGCSGEAVSKVAAAPAVVAVDAEWRW